MILYKFNNICVFYAAKKLNNIDIKGNMGLLIISFNIYCTLRLSGTN